MRKSLRSLRHPRSHLDLDLWSSSSDVRPAPLLEPPSQDFPKSHAGSLMSNSGLSDRFLGVHSGLMSWSSRAFLASQDSVTASLGPVVCGRLDWCVGDDSKQQKKLRSCKEQLKRFSSHGLRTLICGWRVWLVKARACSTAPEVLGC